MEAKPQSRLSNVHLKENFEKIDEGWTKVHPYQQHSQQQKKLGSGGLNTAFVQDESENDSQSIQCKKDDNKDLLDSTAARKKLVNLSGIEFDTEVKEDVKRNKYFETDDDEDDEDEEEEIKEIEDKRVLNEPVTPQKNEKQQKIELRKNKSVKKINNTANQEFDKLNEFIKKGVENKPLDRLRVYSINRIASIKGRQNVQLKKVTEKKKKKDKENVKDTETKSPLKTEIKKAKRDTNLDYEDLTNNKSRLTVTSKRSPQKDKVKDSKLKMIEERQSEKNVLNESINK